MRLHELLVRKGRKLLGVSNLIGTIINRDCTRHEPSRCNKPAGPYKDTVNLPVTKFNMRANSVQREPELQRQWAEQGTYEQLRDNNTGVG